MAPAVQETILNPRVNVLLNPVHITSRFLEQHKQEIVPLTTPKFIPSAMIDLKEDDTLFCQRDRTNIGIRSYFFEENEKCCTLILLPIPEMRCSITAISDKEIVLHWNLPEPPNDVLLEDYTGIHSRELISYLRDYQKQGDIRFPVLKGELQRDKSLWKRTTVHGWNVYRFPKISCKIETDFFK